MVKINTAYTSKGSLLPQSCYSIENFDIYTDLSKKLFDLDQYLGDSRAEIEQKTTNKSYIKTKRR